MRHFILLLIVFSFVCSANAENIYISKDSAISRQSTRQPIDKTFEDVMESLKQAGFTIVKEINIGNNLKKASKEHKWTDYNKNNLIGIRTAIVCSGKTANAISNADPNMVSLCPLHVTLTQIGEWTNVDFIKPSVIAHGSPAKKIAVKLEQRISSAIKEGISLNRLSRKN